MQRQWKRVMAELTPFQTVGPFFAICLCEPGSARLAAADAVGRRITIEGTVRDGAGAVVPDSLVEIWQANAAGRYAHPDDQQPKPLDPNFSGYGRAPTDEEGRFIIETVMPGRVPGPDDTLQAPHLLLGILARGILTRLVTRIYFEDEPSTRNDPILSLVPAERRATLIATRMGDDPYRFDLTLQGDRETVFFDV
jgi:protocatechuate 3,4-dioxygenase alpha subunit